MCIILSYTTASRGSDSFTADALSVRQLGTKSFYRGTLIALFAAADHLRPNQRLLIGVQRGARDAQAIPAGLLRQTMQG